MQRLRAECPWDSAQSFQTIAPYTIEEAYEVSDAVEQNDMPQLKSELGDLLFQVLFHAIMAEENGAFNMDDVCETLVQKMVSRHPHIFDPERIGDRSVPHWEDIKASERAETLENGGSVLDGVALALPALMRAEKLQKRAARTGFDWPDINGVTDKISEEAQEVAEAISSGSHDDIEDEIGDLLFAVTNLSRHAGIDPEIALRRTNKKFSKRFQHIEKQAKKPLKEMSLGEMDALWNAAKSLERNV